MNSINLNMYFYICKIMNIYELLCLWIIKYVFDNKTKPTHSKESVRTSVGYGLKIYSPIGPIGLSWGFPMSSETYDIKREFLFSIGNINWRLFLFYFYLFFILLLQTANN